MLNLRHTAKHRHRYPSLLYYSILTVMVWYFTISLTSYFTFRSETKSYITYNLVPDEWLSICVNLFFAINTLTSYPVQILCCFEILETYKFFNNDVDSNLVKNLKVTGERVLIVIGITLLASTIPNFVAFLNIIGGLGCMILGFILPPLYYMTLYK